VGGQLPDQTADGADGGVQRGGDVVDDQRRHLLGPQLAAGGRVDDGRAEAAGQDVAFGGGAGGELEHGLHLRTGLLGAGVERAEQGERRRGPAEEVVATAGGPADEVGDDAQRQRPGQVGDRVERAAPDQRGDEVGGLLFDAAAQGAARAG
jgi:hypothetical protein